MEAKAIVRYVRITPRKANQILELIRGKDVEAAVTILHFTPKNGARASSATASGTRRCVGACSAVRASRCITSAGS